MIIERKNATQKNSLKFHDKKIKKSKNKKIRKSCTATSSSSPAWLSIPRLSLLLRNKGGGGGKKKMAKGQRRYDKVIRGRGAVLEDNHWERRTV